jgi:DNA-binding beta-propeller fold protein YncE
MSTRRSLIVVGFAASALCLSSAACESPSGGEESLIVTEQSQALAQVKPPPVPQPVNPYTLFETLQVRPLALSPNGKRLFAVNTPDNRLEIFKLNSGSSALKAWSSVSVGLEPISVAVRNEHEVWVVNHLSDSISVVRIDCSDDDDSGGARVVRTLLVGDEPRDIVFGGPNRNLAFVTTAHRGQNIGEDPKPFDPTVGRADVWVFDADNLGSSLTGTRLTKLTFFGDTPRALAVSPDGTRVYAAPFFSGNETTLASKEAVATAYASSVDPTNPNFVFYLGTRQPLTSRVVKRKLGPDGAYHWYDDLGTDFTTAIRVSLPDYDVFTIDATQAVPVAIPAQTYAHVGTTLFNMAVHPSNGKVYISNTEAHNDVRFEGHNPTLGVTSVRGNIADSRITVLEPQTGALTYNNLNKHVVAGVGDASLSRAFPQDMAFSADGSKLFVVAQGSAKLAIYDTAALEDGSAAPTAYNQVLLSAGGPTGVVLDTKKERAFVLTRFDNGISVVNLSSRQESKHIKMFSPEPAKITAGRRFLYDATFTSENGTQACASCHVGGDMDHLSWDLGNPGGIELPITRNAPDNVLFTAPPALISQLVPTAADLFQSFRPVKGPMSTQSLRGLDNHGPMHWRGDRNGAVKQDGTPFLDDAGAAVVSAQPNAGMFDEFAAFFSFNVAFPGLVGRAAQLSDPDMTAFTRFMLELMYPPNPNRALDNSLTAEQQTARAFYNQMQTLPNGTSAELPVDRVHNCNGCHTLDPSGNVGQTDHPGFFGSSGRLSFENLPQIFKVAHLRNAYQKLGMFASSPDSNRTFTAIPQLNPPLSAVRGFGYQPDGAVGQIQHHLTGRVFIKTTNASSPQGQNPGGIPTFVLDANGDPLPQPDPAGFPLRNALASFLISYDSNFKPALGQQVSYGAGSGADVDARIALLTASAQAGDCALVAKAVLSGRERGYIYEAGLYRSDKAGEAASSEAALKTSALNANSTLTFTCVPPNAGYRIGIDRDADGIADGDEH